MKVYNKLVRDKIPEIILADNCTPITRILSDEEYLKELNIKLREELEEYQESSSIEELADMMEVMLGILDVKGVPFNDFEVIRKEKVSKRGTFKKKIYLESVENND
jgi:predicted house-cleaning noncanonical NTP pyrophosphatase (MazG superfamily)